MVWRPSSEYDPIGDWGMVHFAQIVELSTLRALVREEGEAPHDDLQREDRAAGLIACPR